MKEVEENHSVQSAAKHLVKVSCRYLGHGWEDLQYFTNISTTVCRLWVRGGGFDQYGFKIKTLELPFILKFKLI